MDALRRTVEGKVAVVTGASDGIGARLAVRLASAGAIVALVARSEDKLRQVGDEIREAGGVASEHMANLATEIECDEVLRNILSVHGRVDILVCNAGRSIRRSVKYQGQERFHDFQRLMALNYFGALRLALGVLPGMTQRGDGHVIHISSFGVPTRQPRFAGYAASKAAMDAALQCAAGEVAAHGVAMSTVYMPLVATKMVQSKGHSYDHVSMLTVDMACEYVEHAIKTRRAEVIDAPSRFLSLMYIFRPGLINSLNALVYKLESEVAPDGAPAKAISARSCRPRKQGGNKPLLKFLASLMWFFSRAELTLAIRGPVPWIFRDILAVIVMTLVLIVQPIVVAAVMGIKAVRRGLGFSKERSRPTCRQPTPVTLEFSSESAQIKQDLKQEMLPKPTETADASNSASEATLTAVVPAGPKIQRCEEETATDKGNSSDESDMATLPSESTQSPASQRGSGDERMRPADLSPSLPLRSCCAAMAESSPEVGAAIGGA